MERVLEVSKKIWKAIQDEDIAILKEYVYQDALFIHMGVTLSRDDELDVIKNKKIIYKTIDFEDTTIKEIDSTIVLLTKLKMTALVNGKTVINPFVVTEIYSRNNDKIRMVSMSYTKITY